MYSSEFGFYEVVGKDKNGYIMQDVNSDYWFYCKNFEKTFGCKPPKIYDNKIKGKTE